MAKKCKKVQIKYLSVNDKSSDDTGSVYNSIHNV